MLRADWCDIMRDRRTAWLSMPLANFGIIHAHVRTDYGQKNAVFLCCIENGPYYRWRLPVNNRILDRKKKRWPRGQE